MTMPKPKEAERIPTEKEKAMAKVLYALRNRLMLMSIEDRKEALSLARMHAMTVEELIEYAVEHTRRNS